MQGFAGTRLEVKFTSNARNAGSSQSWWYWYTYAAADSMPNQQVQQVSIPLYEPLNDDALTHAKEYDWLEAVPTHLIVSTCASQENHRYVG